MGWKLKDIILMAIVAVVMGAVFYGVLQIGTGIVAGLTPLGYGDIGWEPLYGVYFMAGLLVCYIIRKPGIGIIAEMLAAIIEVLLGNMFGPEVIISGLIHGVAVELVFLIFMYRKWGWAQTILAAVSAAVLSYIHDYFVYSYYMLQPKMIILGIIIRIISAIIFTGIIAKLIADGLNRAGVLKGYKISGNLKDLYED